MRSLLVVILVAGCGSDSKKPVDAAVDTPAGFDCATYCTDIKANCIGTNSQYGMDNLCTSSCAKFDLGTFNAMSGNTLACRIYHTALAKNAPTPHCLHAGPGGGGACGTDCEGFCTIVTKTCATEYPDMGTCMTTCSQFATAPPYSSNVTGGNSLACRLYHATAATVDPGLHCPHTAMTSATCQ